MGEPDLSSSRSLLMPVVLLALCAAAGAQFPFGGDMGGGGPNPMAEMMQRVVSGTLEDVNPVRGYLQVGSYGRDSRIVVVTDDTVVTAMALVPAAELKVGDELSVTGVPVSVVASEARIGAALGLTELMQYFMAEDQGPAEEAPAEGGAEAPAEAEGQPGGMMGAVMGGMMGGGQDAPPPTTRFSGKVKSLDPLVLSLPSGIDIAVSLPEDAVVTRRVEATLEALDFDIQLVALGKVDDDGYLVTDRLYIGESLSLGRMGGRRGGGGGMMFMGGGPPGGMGGGPRGGGRDAGPEEEGPGE